jgi:hypothetical protein
LHEIPGRIRSDNGPVLIPRAVRERGPAHPHSPSATANRTEGFHARVRLRKSGPAAPHALTLAPRATLNYHHPPIAAGQKPWTISHDEAARVHRAVWRNVGCVANASERAAAGDAGNRVSLMPHRRICSQQVDKEPAAVGLTQNFEDTPPHCEGYLMRHLT